MSRHVNQLTIAPADTVGSVRTRLRQLRGQRVLLVWANDSDNLKRRIDLILLQREAHRNAIHLAIVATDKRLARLAAELDISCFVSAEAATSARWKRSRSRVFLPRQHRPRRGMQLAEMARLARESQRAAESHSWRMHVVRFFLFIALVSCVVGLVYAVAPGAVARVTLRQRALSIQVDIVADPKVSAPDLDYAVIPALPLRETVETTATIPTTGTRWLDSAETDGGGNRSVTVVAPNDPARLAELARTQLQSKAYDRMIARLSDSQVIVIESLQIAEEDKDWLAFSAAVGEIADELTLSMRAVATALAVDESLAREVARTQLEASIPEGMALLPDTFALRRGAFGLSRVKRQVRFAASASGVAMARLDIDALRNDLAGASLDEARTILRSHDAIDAQTLGISLHPRGWGRMPILPLRIHIEIQDGA